MRDVLVGTSSGSLRARRGLQGANRMRPRIERLAGFWRAGLASGLLALSVALPVALSVMLSVGTSYAADKAAYTAAEPPPASAAATAPAGRIVFVGHNIFGDADGEFHAWRVVERAVDLAKPTSSHAVVEVRVASLDTGNESRDEHLRTADFFDVEKFPVATVRGHSPQALPPSKEGHPRYSIQLDVELHGVKKTVPGEVEVVGQDPLVVEGRCTLSRTDFGIGSAPSSWNPASIDDAVPVRFRIELR